MDKLENLREWLLDRIDGSEETRGDDGLISDFIRQIDALSSEIAEPRGCPTPGSCSAVEELADLKQRILPQFAGRAQRAEHERDALLEQLIEARSAIQQSYGCLWRYTGSSNPMFLQARKMLLARLTKEQQASGIRYANELFGPTTEHEILHSDCSHDAAPSAMGAPVAWMYDQATYTDTDVRGRGWNPVMGKYDPKNPSMTRNVVALYAAPVEEIAIGHARYEYLRTLNPRKFAALYNEALMGVYQFDDLVDRRRVKGEPVDHGYDRTASLNAGHYVCTCGGACSSPITGEQSK